MSPTGHYPRVSTADRFLAKVVKGDGCWGWSGGHNGKGYGAFHLTDRLVLAHRYAYEHFVGQIPDGLQIDHLCRNRGCVNPDHLEAVTHQENMRRGIKGSLTTHCPKGHPYDEANTYRGPSGRRTCRACRSAASNASHRAQRARKGVQSSVCLRCGAPNPYKRAETAAVDA